MRPTITGIAVLCCPPTPHPRTLHFPFLPTHLYTPLRVFKCHTLIPQYQALTTSTGTPYQSIKCQTLQLLGSDTHHELKDNTPKSAIGLGGSQKSNLNASSSRNIRSRSPEVRRRSTTSHQRLNLYLPCVVHPGVLGLVDPSAFGCGPYHNLYSPKGVSDSRVVHKGGFHCRRFERTETHTAVVRDPAFLTSVYLAASLAVADL
jgi:hypothetical protein